MADVALAGTLFASHYAAANRCHLTARESAIFAEPSTGARAVSQLVMGEAFDVFDIVSGWAWGRCAHDDYVGYLPADRLGSVPTATHRVRVAQALVFRDPDIKAPVVDRWPLGAMFAGEAAGDFVAGEAGFVHSRHAIALTEHVEPLAIAQAMLGQPYLWGGRGGGGIDCSGLVQVALSFAGIACPRDSDMQREALGEALPVGAEMRAGDIVFFPGHVGLMMDETRLIHANAFAMAVSIEPLADVVARIGGSEAIVARRRLA